MHNQFYGRCDKRIDELTPYIFVGEFVETRTFELPMNQKKSIVYFTKIDDYMCNYGYTNMKIFGNLNLIENVCFLSTCIIDRIYPKITGASSIPLLTDNIIPSINSHMQHHLYVELTENCNSDIKITFDVVKIMNPIEENKTAQFVFLQSQMDNHKIKKGNNELTLYFNHPVSKISIVSNAKLTNINMNLDGHIVEFRSNEHIFDPIVNFSKIDKIILNFESEDESEDDSEAFIIANNKNIAVIDNKNFGILYPN